MSLRLTTENDFLDYAKFKIFTFILLSKQQKTELSFAQVFNKLNNDLSNADYSHFKTISFRKFKKTFDDASVLYSNIDLKEEGIHSFLNKTINLSIKEIRVLIVIIEHIPEIKLDKKIVNSLFKIKYGVKLLPRDIRNGVDSAFNILSGIDNRLQINQDQKEVNVDIGSLLNTKEKTKIDIDKIKLSYISFLIDVLDSEYSSKEKIEVYIKENSEYSNINKSTKSQIVKVCTSANLYLDKKLNDYIAKLNFNVEALEVEALEVEALEVEALEVEALEEQIIKKIENKDNALNITITPIERKKKYKINDKEYFFSIGDFNIYASELGYEVDMNNEKYRLLLSKNQVALQELANEEIEIYAKDLKEELLKTNRNLSKYGFSRIYYLDSPISMFNTLSRDYKDFKESEAIKRNDYFEIILEYKQNTATRDYLDLFLKEEKDKCLEKGMDSESFENIVDTSLCSWYRNIEEVEIRSADVEFLTGNSVPLLYTDKNENIYMPKEKWFEYKITLDIEKDKATFEGLEKRDLFKILLKTPHEDIANLTKKLLEFNDDDLLQFWAINVFCLKEEEFANKEDMAKALIKKYLIKYRDDSAGISNIQYENHLIYEKLISFHSKWIFDYNKKILDSKKEIISNALESYFQ